MQFMRVVWAARVRMPRRKPGYTYLICVGHRIAVWCFGRSTITRTLVERVATILLSNSLGQASKGRDQS